MGRLLSCVLLIASAIGCGNPSRATVDASEQPPVDAPAAPGTFGGACSKHTDCESGYCVEPVGNTGGVCSRVCNDDCPPDWECRSVTLPQANVRLCVPAAKQLCLACANDTECGGGACLNIDGGGRCATPCSGQCPTGYTCAADPDALHPGNFCQPITHSCSCSDAMAGAQRSCSNMNGTGTCFGTQNCNAGTGWTTCTALVPAAETCDGVDNDCNFVIDDGVGGGQACQNTNGFGSCAGIRQCDGSNGFVCVGQVPAAEMCNGLDDNCNGQIDEAYAGLGSSCTTGIGACTRYGSLRCNGTQNGLVCSAVAGTPGTELCNQVDDNCDGSVDEPFKTGATALGSVCSAGVGVCTQYGTYVCRTDGTATQCSATPAAGNATTETCNYLDDNCDGLVDNGFLNPNTGFYDQDRNCGACGNDCTTLYTAANAFGACQVTTSPQCVMRCNPGSGNLNGSTLDGCEFTLDAAAIYVSTADATAVDDATCGLGPTGTGAGNHPCETITQGFLRGTATGRTKVLVADGTYNEGVILVNGRMLLGGYRADTWERHLATTNTVIAGTTVSGNHDRAVLAASITSPTIFEGFVVRGSFNTKPSGNSYAVYVSNSNANLIIRNNQIFAGRGGSGSAGTPGANGTAGTNGATYASSTYDSFQTTGATKCASTNNRLAYGGGARSCSGDDVGGGNGGGNNCTPSRSTQNSTASSPALAGQPGAGAGGGAGGASGTRGYDADLNQNTCLVPVQGQAILPMFGTDGQAGGSGAAAPAVAGCTSSTGSVASGEWVGGPANAGVVGSAGGGGGGGGAGGGATCTFCVRQGNFFVAGNDILGAHGGGGASGGCGGNGGGPGATGGGAFAIFVTGGTAPTITNNAITMGTGGSGGTGGIGGAGGLGGVGTTGGDQGTATILFCSGKGGRGGDGGNGGPGSGGGGGCGGSSFGIYTSGVGTPTYCSGLGNTVSGGAVGTGGPGGYSGGNSGGAGADGVLQACTSI